MLLTLLVQVRSLVPPFCADHFSSSENKGMQTPAPPRVIFYIALEDSCVHLVSP